MLKMEGEWEEGAVEGKRVGGVAQEIAESLGTVGCRDERVCACYMS